MTRLQMRAHALTALGLCLLASPLATRAVAQDRPVVFVHGFNSNPGTWDEASGRLRGRLAIETFAPGVTWRQSVESQANEVQNQVGWLPNSSIVIGHSLGGIVSRQWTRQHGVDGVVTIGSPHRGAPLANHIGQWLGFNDDLFYAVGSAFYHLGFMSYDQWWWLLPALEAILSEAGYIQDLTLRHFLITFGLHYGSPFIFSIYTGSPFLDDLNGGNLGREVAQIPYRVGIVNTMTDYWDSGFWRLLDPENGRTYGLLVFGAAVGLDYWAYTILADADPLDYDAQETAWNMLRASFWLFNFDEFWCRAVSDNRDLWHGACQPNDAFIPRWSQFYPSATTNFDVVSNAPHSRETRWLDDLFYVALTDVMHVPPRGGPPPPPPPGGSDTLSNDQFLSPEQSITSADGRFRLTYQGDGNLVLYRWDGVPLWHTHTYGTSAGRATMQVDGNLVVYDANGTPLWWSGTHGFNGSRVVMHNDGNLVIYTPEGSAIWASGTGGY
jgi:pimeloyl-ACP methyl ester carboxylesterase